jgi:hypothetical protein
MVAHKDRRKDDESSAPEAGTVRDDTSGNQPAHPQDRPGPLKPKQDAKAKQADIRQTGGNASVACEER